MTRFKYFSKNGQILPAEQAVISIDNLEYAYGFGVYETIRVNNKVPLFLSDHTERLINSANIIELDHPFSKDQVEGHVQNLVDQIDEPTYNLKILLIGGKTAEEVLLFILPLAPYFLDKKMYQEGVSVVTYQYERLFPNAKTLNMLSSYLAYRKAKNENCYDALFIDKTGNILEGTRTNFFAIKGRTLFIPPIKQILAGVTRKKVIEAAKENDYKVVEQDLKLAEIENYEGAFLTSTSSKILPIKKIDNFEFRDVSTELIHLIKLFNEFLDKHTISI